MNSRLAVALLAWILAAASAGAQVQTGTTDIAVSGFVNDVISGGGVRDLDFGTVIPGAAVTVAVASPAAAKWEFTGIPNNNGVANRFADLNFIALPTELVGPGGATIPLSNFVARVALSKNGAEYHTYGDYSVTPATPSIDPNPRINGAGVPAAPGGNTGRSLVVYMGATATPTVGQRAGMYTATLTLTFGTASS